MSKRHTIYVLIDKDGKYVDAFLSFSEAVREQRLGQKIVQVRDREDY